MQDSQVHPFGCIASMAFLEPLRSGDESIYRQNYYNLRHDNRYQGHGRSRMGLQINRSLDQNRLHVRESHRNVRSAQLIIASIILSESWQLFYMVRLRLWVLNVVNIKQLSPSWRMNWRCHMNRKHIYVRSSFASTWAVNNQAQA